MSTTAYAELGFGLLLSDFELPAGVDRRPRCDRCRKPSPGKAFCGDCGGRIQATVDDDLKRDIFDDDTGIFTVSDYLDLVLYQPLCASEATPVDAAGVFSLRDVAVAAFAAKAITFDSASVKLYLVPSLG